MACSRHGEGRGTLASTVEDSLRDLSGVGNPYVSLETEENHRIVTSPIFLPSHMYSIGIERTWVGTGNKAVGARLGHVSICKYSVLK